MLFTLLAGVFGIWLLHLDCKITKEFDVASSGDTPSAGPSADQNHRNTQLGAIAGSAKKNGQATIILAKVPVMGKEMTTGNRQLSLIPPKQMGRSEWPIVIAVILLAGLTIWSSGYWLS